MAQPQGLNVPAIATTGVVTVLLTAIIVEGVRALYFFEEPREEARKWDGQGRSTPQRLKEEQQQNLMSAKTRVPIDAAMAKVVETNGKMPSTRPNG